VINQELSMPSPNIIVIGASAGGPRILKELFAGMPPLNASIVIVQHMPKFVNESLCESLSRCTEMRVSVAQNGEQLERKKVYVAPSEVHLTLVDNQKVWLFNGERVNFACPSIDVAMSSLQKILGIGVVGVILTGMGKDGADGIRHIKKIGGTTIAQDEKTSIIYGMPKEACETGAIDFVLSPKLIMNKLIELVGVV